MNSLFKKNNIKSNIFYIVLPFFYLLKDDFHMDSIAYKLWHI